MDIKTGFKEGVAAARALGAEFQANPGSSRTEYLKDCAEYFGYDSFLELPEKERNACSDAFGEGIRAEKLLQ